MALENRLRREIQDLHAMLEREKEAQSLFAKLHIYSLFLTQKVEIRRIFALQVVVSQIKTDFQNCHV